MRHCAYLTIVCLTILMISCSESRKGVNSIVITGSDKSISNEVLYLFDSENLISGSANLAIDSCLVDSAGNFSFSIEADKPDFYQFRSRYGLEIFFGRYAFLCPGDSLIISFKDEKIELQGNAGTINQIQWDLSSVVFNDSVLKKNSNYWDRSKLEPQEFVIYMDKLKRAQSEYFSNISNEITVPDIYKKYIYAIINCQWVNEYWRYLEYHNYYAHDEWNYLPVDSVNSEFLARWEPDSLFHFMYSYHECIKGYVDHLYYHNTKDIPDTLKLETEFSDKFSIIKNNFQGIAKDVAIVSFEDDFWYYLFDNEDFYKQLIEVNTYFKNNHQLENYYAYFLNQYEDYLEISPGKPAPDFTLPDTSDNLVSLSDFIGKVVYIDFWGTWCGPCIASIPKHIELQENFKDQDVITFLNIALEYDQENIKSWKKYLTDNNFPGIHLVAERQFRNEQLEPYMLSAAPSYVLIDKNGEIVLTRASGPEKIYDDIIELLGN